MRKFMIYGAVILIIILAAGSFGTGSAAEKAYPEEVRLRIISNSEKEIDQEIKNQVKEETFSFLDSFMEEEKNFEIVINKIKLNIILLEEKLKKIVSKFTITFENHKYPIKLSDGTLEYERVVYTLLIQIEEAKGSNYFTTLYPNFIKKDEEKVVFESFFQKILDKLKNGG